MASSKTADNRVKTRDIDFPRRPTRRSKGLLELRDSLGTTTPVLSPEEVAKFLSGIADVASGSYHNEDVAEC